MSLVSVISTVMTVFAWAVLIFTVAMMVGHLFLARRRSWILAVIRVGVTVVSLIAALLIAKPLSATLTDIVYDMLCTDVLPGLGADMDINGILTSIPSGTEGLRVLVSLLVAPILFFLLFVVLRAVLSIPCAIVGTLVPVLKKKTLPAVAMSVGAFHGLLISVVLLIPLCGFIVVGGHMMSTVAKTADECDSPQIAQMMSDMGTTTQELDDLGEALEGNPAVAAVHGTLGRPVFNALTTGKTDPAETHNTVVKLNLETEIGGLVETGIYLVDVVDSFGKTDYSEEDKNRMFRFEESLLESKWRTMLVTDALTASAGSWRKGEPFAGYARPSLDPAIDPTIDCILDILANESDLTLEKDIHDILDVLGDFLMCNLMSSSIDPQQMLVTMNERGLLTTTMAKLNANPRLAPITAELKALSVRLLTNMLGLEELKNGEHAEMINNVAGELNKVLDMSEDERHEAVAEALGTAFEEYGFEVPADVANELADAAIAELGADGEITGDELTDYFVNHVDDAADLIPDGLPDDLPSDIPDISFD